MDGEDIVHAGRRQQLRVQVGREGLAIELLVVLGVADERDASEFGSCAAVLGAVEEVGLDEDDALGAIVLGGAGHEEVAHGPGVARQETAAGGDDDDGLAVKGVPDVVEVVLVGDEARTEFRVGEVLVGDEIGDFGLLPHVMRDIACEGIITHDTYHNDIVDHTATS